MTADEVLAVARAGAEAGCHEALFTLGDKPELRYRAARDELAALGCETTIEYLARMCELVLAETGLLPHVNPGVMTRAELALLRTVSASQGIMLETASERLSQKGGPHYGSPDKRPERRLETIGLAGELEIPFTTGILIGIGETRAERIEALEAIRALHERYGHVQEVIVQNFRAKAGTKMAGHPEPPLEDLLWTARAAREVLGPDMHVQVPPNLSYDDFPRLLEAAIDDWGGVSPVTMDHVNPEAPWPAIELLRAATEAAGFELAARLPIYPEYVADLGRWADPRVAREIRRHADADGLARELRWAAGAETPSPQLVNANGRPPGTRVADVLAKARDEIELDEEDVTTLFRARGADLHAVLGAADRLRREVGRVGLDQQELRGEVCGGPVEVGRLRIRDVAGERAEVAALDGLVEMAGGGEAVQDHRGERGGVLSQDGEGVVLGGAGVNRDRQLEARRELELGLERAALVVARGVVAVVVEACLAERADLGPRVELVVRHCDLHGSTLAYSGSMGNSVRITENHISGNTSGIRPATVRSSSTRPDRTSRAKKISWLVLHS